MSNKIPCGGFKLDNNFFGMNENDELSLTGGSEGEGKAYKQLVTDGTGNVKWEDRLAYDDSKLAINGGPGGAKYVKVADEVPSWVSMDAPTKVWFSNGTNNTAPTDYYIDFGNGSFGVRSFVVFIATDNVEYNGFVFPEKGVYFVSVPDDFYITGIASADSDTPEITWDGSLEVIKKIDEKFLPDQPVFYTSGTYLVDAEGAYITLEQAKAVGLNFIIQIDSGIARPISADYYGNSASFYVAKMTSDGVFGFTTYDAGEQK